MAIGSTWRAEVTAYWAGLDRPDAHALRFYDTLRRSSMTARNAQSWGAQPDVPDTHFVSGDVYTDPAIFDDEKKKVFEKFLKKTNEKNKET